MNQSIESIGCAGRLAFPESWNLSHPVQKVLMQLGRRMERIIWPRSDRHFYLPRPVIDLDDPMLYGSIARKFGRNRGGRRQEHNDQWSNGRAKY